MFVSMGLQNPRLYINRTILAVIVIAGAAVILSAALSTQSGFLLSTQLYLRSYLGGDIVVLPGKFVFAEGDFTSSATPWAWRDYGLARNELPGSLIRLTKDGYLTTDHQVAQVDQSRLQSVTEHHPEVVGTYPYYYLPGIVELPGENGMVGFAMPIRGRDVQLDQHWDLEYAYRRGQGLPDYEGMVAEAMAGSLPQIEQFRKQDGELVCMLNSAAFPSGFKAPPAGSMVTVQIPTFDSSKQAFDYSQLQAFELKVIGHYTVPANSYYIGWSQRTPFFWATPGLHLPLSTWQSLAGAVGAPTSSEQFNQVGLMLNSTVEANRIARELQAELPEYTVLTATELGNLIPRVSNQAGTPIDMDRAIHIMTLLITSSIVAANAFLLVMQRRKEIAILKSMGASSFNIVTMILSELVTIACVASFGGTFIYRLFYSITMIYNQVPWSLVWHSSLAVIGQVVLALCLSTTVFGLIPAVKAAVTPVMEVMRDA